MDDVVLDFLADLYIAERVEEKTGETFLQFVARKEREWQTKGGVQVQPISQQVKPISQLEAWKRLAAQSRNWKVINTALRHIEMLEKKEQARWLAQKR